MDSGRLHDNVRRKLQFLLLPDYKTDSQGFQDERDKGLPDRHSILDRRYLFLGKEFLWNLRRSFKALLLPGIDHHNDDGICDYRL